MLNSEALQAADVAAMLHVGKKTVYELAKTGELPSYKIGRKLFFSPEDVETYIASVRTGGSSHGRTGQNQGAGRGVVLDQTGGFASLAPNVSGAFSPVGGPVNEGAGIFRIGGVGLPTSLLVDRLAELGFTAQHAIMPSYPALCGIYEGICDAAIVHLYDQQTNSYNVPYVQRLMPGMPVVVIRMAKRQQGFVVAKGNPKSISSWGALLRPETRLANRLRGCGSRILLDEKLLAMEAHFDTIAGYNYEHPSGLTAAQAVETGVADVAVVGEQIAALCSGVDFIPLQTEWLDLVIAKRPQNRPIIRQIKDVVTNPLFKSEYGRIIHSDAANLGAIIYER